MCDPQYAKFLHFTLCDEWPPNLPQLNITQKSLDLGAISHASPRVQNHSELTSAMHAVELERLYLRQTTIGKVLKPCQISERPLVC